MAKRTAPKPATDASQPAKPAHVPPTPAQVLCRTMGCGRIMAESMVAQLGERASKLPGLYAKDDIDGIHALLTPAPPQPEDIDTQEAEGGTKDRPSDQAQ